LLWENPCREEKKSPGSWPGPEKTILRYDDDKPGSPASPDPGAEYLAKGLFKDRETARSMQSFFKLGSKEWRQCQKEIDGIDRRLIELSKRSQPAAHKSKPVQRRNRPAKRAKAKPAVAGQGLVYGSRNENIIRRRAIVRQNPLVQGEGLCELWDNSSPPIVLPRRMKEAGSWHKAYRSPEYRHAVESLISKDRAIVRS
jgi:hypothetical protein